MVRSQTQRILWTLVAVLAATIIGRAEAGRPMDTLLPGTTRGYLSVPNVQQFRSRWRETQLGQLMLDPAMQPFVKDIRRQLQERMTRLHQRIGLELADLEDVAGGEASVAVVERPDGKAAVVVLVDVTGHLDQARVVLAKMGRRLIDRKAKKETRQVAGAELTVYTLPPTAAAKQPREAALFIHDQMLCGSDSRAIAESILRRLATPADDSLAQQPAYRQSMARCQQAAGQATPDLRWFVDPFDLVGSLRATVPPEKRKRRGKDILKILADQGFNAIEGVGGFVHLHMDGKYELIHRTAIYAPPVKGKTSDGDRYELAARAMNFPNGGTLAPPPWVPREIALYATLNWEIQQAFDATETLVDALIGQEGAFQDILDGIREDPVGPQIDLRSQLVGHLGRRATVITDYQLPITPQSERWLLGIETTDQTALVRAINQTMESDPNARQHEFEGHVVWEIKDEEIDLPELMIESPALDPLLASAEEEAAEELAEERGSLPSSAVCVAYGQLLVASHFDFLVKVLVEASQHETLAKTADYNLVMQQFDKIGSGDICLRLFSRTDEEYRPTYELIRTGRMPESESLFGKLLNVLLGEDDEDVLRPQRIDGSKLPDFEMVRRYVGPAGMTVQTNAEGWFATGFMLNKETP